MNLQVHLHFGNSIPRCNRVVDDKTQFTTDVAQVTCVACLRAIGHFESSTKQKHTKLFTILRQKGLSQRDFARLMGYASFTSCNTFLKYDYNPSVELMKKWAKKLNIKAADLIQEDEENENGTVSHELPKGNTTNDNREERLHRASEEETEPTLIQ